MPASRGFTLIEVLMATAILVVGVAALAQLFVLAVSANATSRVATAGVVLAQQKIEQLTAAGARLTPSPPDALAANEPGYCEFVAEGGDAVDCDAPRPGAALFQRRWSVEPLPEDPDDNVVVQVSVTRNREESRLVAVVSRVPSP